MVHLAFLVVLLIGVRLLFIINHRQKHMAKTNEEILAELSEIKASQAQTNESLTNISNDITTLQGQNATLQASVDDLTTKLANAGQLSQEVSDALDTVKQSAQDIATTTAAIAGRVPDVEPPVENGGE